MEEIHESGYRVTAHTVLRGSAELEASWDDSESDSSELVAERWTRAATSDPMRRVAKTAREMAMILRRRFCGEIRWCTSEGFTLS